MDKKFLILVVVAVVIASTLAVSSLVSSDAAVPDVKKPSVFTAEILIDEGYSPLEVSRMSPEDMSAIVNEVWHRYYLEVGYLGE